MKERCQYFFALLLAVLTLGAVAQDAPKMLESHPRNGYTVETWEIYPDDFLAVKTLVLVPDNAKAGKTCTWVKMMIDRQERGK